MIIHSASTFEFAYIASFYFCTFCRSQVSDTRWEAMLSSAERIKHTTYSGVGSSSQGIYLHLFIVEP